MALINLRTGYYGFTLAGTAGGTPSDNNGQVNRCIFSIVYPYQVTDVDFTITSGAEDWAAQMGDGEIIPLSNPSVLYQNRDNSIIQFDMSKPYASNSPCFLVYRSDTASFNIQPRNSDRPFEVNSVTGHFAITTDGYGGVTTEHGLVTRVIATIPFPQQITDVIFTISNDPSHWGVRVGDGTIITLRGAEVVATNRDNAVVVFTMDTPYPANSPCILVYRSPDANISVKVDPNANKFVPATGIRGVPESIVTGVPVDLSTVEVEPFNATVQGIVWEIESGQATVDGDTLIAMNNGSIVLKGTLPGALDEEGKGDLVKRFNINVVKNNITIKAQPPATVSLIYGETVFKMSITAESISGDMRYKWYKNSAASTSGAVAVAGAIESSFDLPENLTLGDHYYYCVLSSPGAANVISSYSKVTVTSELTGIEITPRPSVMIVGDTQKLSVKAIPNTSAAPIVAWESNNLNIAQIDKDGNLKIVGDGGTAKITATTADKKFSDNIVISVAAHVPVIHIDNTTSEIDTNTPTTLVGTVRPNDATNKGIAWTVLDPGSTGATINAGVLTATGVGTCKIRATIRNGAGLNTDYVQDVSIIVNKKFVPVTDIKLTLPAQFRAGEKVKLTGSVTPEDATYNVISFIVSSPGITGATITDGILEATAAGTFNITGTVLKGKSESENFTKNFVVDVLPKWIPVEGISGIPAAMEDVTLGITLDCKTIPENASSQQIVFKLISGSAANAKLEANRITVDYENVVWWVKNPNATPPEYYDQWLENITDPIIIEAIVPNGVKTGEDFVLRKEIGIFSPPAPDIVIPLNDINLELPSIMRARRPLVMNRVIRDPWNATNGEIFIDFAREETGQPGFALTFEPDTEPPEYWKERYNLTLDPIYNWEMGGWYMYSFEDIAASVKYQVAKGNEDGTSFIKTDTLTFLPEYIPVMDITNIPSSLPKNAVIQLAPEFDTKKDITILNTEVYDLEIPSYTQVIWSIVSSGRTGASITEDGVLSFERTGYVTIQAEVPQGTQEHYTWYDKEFPALSYKKQFDIEVTDSESEFSAGIAWLKLKNGSTITVKKVCDFQNLCNNLPADATINVGSYRIKKSDIVEVKFWNKNPSSIGPDATIPITNISLRNETLALNSFDPPAGETLEAFAGVVPDTVTDGCVQETQDGPELDMWKLPDFTFLKPDGTIIKYYQTSSGVYGETILNKGKHINATFIANLEDVHWPSYFIKYDNGYVRIPEGTYLDSDCKLRYIGGLWCEVDKYGIAYSYTDGRHSKVPIGSKIGNGKIIVYDRYAYDGNANVTELDNVENGVPVPVNHDIEAVSNQHDGYLYFNDFGYNCTISSLGLRTEWTSPYFVSDTGNITILSDGTTYGTVSGSDVMFDADGNQIDNILILDTNNVIITPTNSTKKANDIIWGMTEKPATSAGRYSKLIQIPAPNRSGRSGAILIAGDTVESVALTATVIDGVGQNGQDYVQRLKVDIGSVSSLGKIITGINTNYYKKLVFEDRFYSQYIDLTASLIGVGVTSSDANNISWSISGNKSSTGFSTGDWWGSVNSTATGSSVSVKISNKERAGSNIQIKARYGSIETIVTLIMASEYEPEPEISSLHNFGCNFTSLTKIDRIPDIITGENCLKNFLKGCTSFNQAITIPSHVTGDSCLEGFLSGCTLFNQPIVIPSGVAGKRCLNRFLSGCTSYNQHIVIPEGITGPLCLTRFLENCKSFNQQIVIPEGVTGERCLEYFLAGCETFNQPIKIPDGISGNSCMRAFMANTMDMISNITINQTAADNCEVNGLTLSCYRRDVAYDIGVPIVGTGAAAFCAKLPNMILTIPLRVLICREPAPVV